MKCPHVDIDCKFVDTSGMNKTQSCQTCYVYRTKNKPANIGSIGVLTQKNTKITFHYKKMIYDT